MKKPLVIKGKGFTFESYYDEDGEKCVKLMPGGDSSVILRKSTVTWQIADNDGEITITEDGSENGKMHYRVVGSIENLLDIGKKLDAHFVCP